MWGGKPAIWTGSVACSPGLAPFGAAAPRSRRDCSLRRRCSTSSRRAPVDVSGGGGGRTVIEGGGERGGERGERGGLSARLESGEGGKRGESRHSTSIHAPQTQHPTPTNNTDPQTGLESHSSYSPDTSASSYTRCAGPHTARILGGKGSQPTPAGGGGGEGQTAVVEYQLVCTGQRGRQEEKEEWELHAGRGS